MYIYIEESICEIRRLIYRKTGESFYKVSNRSRSSSWLFSSQPAINKLVKSSSLKLTCVDSGTSDRLSGIGGDTLLGGVSYRVLLDKQLLGGVQLLLVWEGVLNVIVVTVVEDCFFVPRTRCEIAAERRLDRLPSSILSRSNFQKPPLPGSSLERGNFTKHLFSDKLCRMEFCSERKKIDKRWKDKSFFHLDVKQIYMYTEIYYANICTVLYVIFNVMEKEKGKILPARLDRRTCKRENSLGSMRRCSRGIPCCCWRALRDK